MSLKIRIHNAAIKNTTLERTLASAAPLTPIAGKPNHPNISIGSNTALIMAEEAIKTEGVFASPAALITELPIIGTAIKSPPQ